MPATRLRNLVGIVGYWINTPNAKSIASGALVLGLVFVSISLLTVCWVTGRYSNHDFWDNLLAEGHGLVCEATLIGLLLYVINAMWTSSRLRPLQLYVLAELAEKNDACLTSLARLGDSSREESVFYFGERPVRLHGFQNCTFGLWSEYWIVLVEHGKLTLEEQFRSPIENLSQLERALKQFQGSLDHVFEPDFVLLAIKAHDSISNIQNHFAGLIESSAHLPPEPPLSKLAYEGLHLLPYTIILLELKARIERFATGRESLDAHRDKQNKELRRALDQASEATKEIEKIKADLEGRFGKRKTTEEN